MKPEERKRAIKAVADQLNWEVREALREGIEVKVSTCSEPEGSAPTTFIHFPRSSYPPFDGAANMDMTKPLPRWETDPDVVCPSQHPWQAHRTADMDESLSNVICPASDMIIATQLPNRMAMQIADSHNGLFTEHGTDQTSLIHD